MVELIKGMQSDLSRVVVADLGNKTAGFFQVNPDNHFLDTATIGIAAVALGDLHHGDGVPGAVLAT